MAVRFNNPGNIRFNAADKWQGAATPPNQEAFCAFNSPIMGIRAIARVLITFQDKHNCRTVRDFISRYAPPGDNNPTEKYIGNIIEWGSFDQAQQLNVHTYADCEPLVRGIIRQEQGAQPYSDAQIDEALKLAGIVPLSTPSMTIALANDPKVIAAGVAGTAATVQATVSSVSDIWDTLGQHIDPRILIWSCVAIVVGFGIWYAIQKIQARRAGLT